MDDKNGAFPFELDPDSGLSPWLQLRKRLIYLIDSGYLKPGDQLPKIRELAVEISINFNTVNKAYLSLQSDGYLKSIRGKGVFVSDAIPGHQEGQTKDIEAIIDDCLHVCRNLGLTYQEAAEWTALRAKVLTMSESIPYRVSGSNVIVIGDDDQNVSKKGEA
ncbi:MAG: GntR family transcriptional regulator [Raoultibacter sp.]